MARRLRARPSRILSSRSRRILIAVLATATGLLLACSALTIGLFLISRRVSTELTTSTVRDPRSAVLTVAVSPEKQALIEALVRQFNEQRQRTPDDEVMAVRVQVMDPEAMVEAALKEPDFQALTPDSSLWLDQLDRAYASQVGEKGIIAPRLVAETVRYAVSPIVIAAWEPVARELGWPERPVGWRDIQRKAQADPDFKWNHASTSHASGLLATLAEFYAGAGKARDLTIEDVQAQATLDYVAAIERTVRYYGEGELAVLERARAEGRRYLDAFVIQEQLVVQFNLSQPPERLVAIYPAEGTLWADHPLALLERPEPTANQRRTFQAFREFLLSPEAQRQVLAAGYRPADLSIPLDGPDSPLTAANGVDPMQPHTTLQVPSPAVVDVVRNVWWYTKRHTNVFLVVDTSGSMRGEKLEAAREALRVFLDQMQGDLERVGLIEFSSQVNHIEPLAELRENRGRLQERIDALEARGNTALLDAVRTAYARLRRLNDAERINAIVVMTDGRENASNVRLDELTEEIRRGNQEGPPIVIFAIAYGEDADYEVLQALADASGGQVREGDLETIRQLYKILSSYF
ncbi:MAG: VWA domain-containing protein [Anaerolineae bacterium]|nr:VWA domain-containing protein [Anaerolineae bacterium]MDW8099106.1 VWA domain-containing protein [Anaerolineae bacterium]